MKRFPLYTCFLSTMCFWVSRRSGSQNGVDYSKPSSYALPLKNNLKVSSLLSLLFIWVFYRPYHNLRNKKHSKISYEDIGIIKMIKDNAYIL